MTAMRKLIDSRRTICVAALAILMAFTVSLVKYRRDEVNYLNADATWHTLLTIEAYNETPASQHLFLPIVSLGGAENKFIPWGSTVPDAEGNYYYTSFSPAGYVAPWLFFKAFHLPVCEKSLYIFNSLLYCVSAALWTLFILQIYAASEKRYLLGIIGAVSYALAPELLHGMGIVYWHQSLMQVTLLIQVIAFWRMRESSSKAAKVVFYLFALLNPYIEWTGFVANVGFALFGLLEGGRAGFKKAFKRGLALFGTTVLSFALFVGHYLLRVNISSFEYALYQRFLARGLATPVKLTSVFSGYIRSFLFLWLLLAVLAVWAFIKKRKVTLSRPMRALLFVFAFIMLENIIMKSHAVAYTYDRMKGIFLLSLLICECANQLMAADSRRGIAVSVLLLTCLAGALNLKSYMGDTGYTWATDYRAGNQAIAGYINENYPDSVLALEDDSVRGYMNLLFMRGIYENISADDAKELAAANGNRYAIVLEIADYGAWNVYDLGGATIYDLQTGEAGHLAETDGNLAYSVVQP